MVTANTKSTRRGLSKVKERGEKKAKARWRGGIGAEGAEKIARRRREKKRRFEIAKCILAIGNHHLRLLIFKIFAAARRLAFHVFISVVKTLLQIYRCKKLLEISSVKKCHFPKREKTPSRRKPP